MDNYFADGSSPVDPRKTQVIYVSGDLSSKSRLGPDQESGFLRGLIFVHAARHRKVLIYLGLCAIAIASCTVYIFISDQLGAWLLGVCTAVTMAAVSTIVQFAERYFRRD